MYTNKYPIKILFFKLVFLFKKKSDFLLLAELINSQRTQTFIRADIEKRNLWRKH